MEQNKESLGLLDYITSPGFCVKENIITAVNAAAQAMLIAPGTDISTLLHTGQKEYAAFHSGCLFLTLEVGTQLVEASVSAENGAHIFLLDPLAENSALRALSLAARELRNPLSSLQITAHQLTSQAGIPTDQLARLNRSLHQLQRMLGNMSDAGFLPGDYRHEMTNVPRLLDEIFEKAQTLLEPTGVQLSYQGLDPDIYTLADRDLLERAVLNILSNARKFLPENGSITARLTRKGRLLYLQILDNGPGIPEAIRGSIFRRYQRQPGIEDSRYGLGLGLVLVRNAAAVHRGTVLIDSPRGIGTRITLTLAIREDSSARVQSPILSVDYAGEQDHALIELADVLPFTAYEF